MATDVNTRHARRHLQRLVDFLGEVEIRDQMKKIRRELQAEKANVHYVRNWLEPRRAWWLGLGEALELDRAGMSLRHRVSPNMEGMLASAASLACLFRGMPLSKRKEYRIRLLASLDPTPVLLELDVAAHYARGGYHIEWPASGAATGCRSPEFIGVGLRSEIEIECRAKMEEAGRKVAGRNFYRLIDEIDQPLLESQASGWVDVIVPDSIPRAPGWRTEVRDALVDPVIWNAGGTTLADGTRIDVALRKPGEDLRLRREALQEEAVRLLEEVPFAHVAVAGQCQAGMLSSPVFIRVRSGKPDRIARSIFGDLCDKKNQFSGKRAAILWCYLPGVESFEPLRTGVLPNMTSKFFVEHAPVWVAAVVYSSDVRIIEETLPGARARSLEAASLSFRNPRYDEARFGPVALPTAQG